MTVERDPVSADAARRFLGGRSEIEIVCADWRTILDRGPFELVFTDVPDAKVVGGDAVIAATKPGGLIGIDDLTPLDQWPEEWRGQPDDVRDFWFGASGVEAVEVRTAITEAVILAVRR